MTPGMVEGTPQIGRAQEEEVQLIPHFPFHKVSGECVRLCMRVCVRLCVCVGMHVCVRMCVCACV